MLLSAPVSNLRLEALGALGALLEALGALGAGGATDLRAHPHRIKGAEPRPPLICGLLYVQSSASEGQMTSR